MYFTKKVRYKCRGGPQLVTGRGYILKWEKYEIRIGNGRVRIKTGKKLETGTKKGR